MQPNGIVFADHPSPKSHTNQKEINITWRIAVLVAALALPAIPAQAAPAFGAGLNAGFFNNFEVQLRSSAACTPTTCLPFDPANDPVGFQRVNPAVAGNVQVGDIFAGILNVQNIDAGGVTVYDSEPGDRFTGYFAQQVLAITPSALDPSGEDHITLGAVAVDPFGELAAGEMFRLYSDVAAFESNGTTFQDIDLATSGTFWASLGLGTEGFAYTHTDLTVLINASDTESFLGSDIIVRGPGYNAGTLAKINDPNENEVGGVTASIVCSPAEQANPLIRCTDIIATSELELNPDFTLGTSPWVFRSNDPFQLFQIPEPGAVTLLALGLIGLGAFRRRWSA